jgi:transcriptional regulator GlxA family with amidase domain
MDEVSSIVSSLHRSRTNAYRTGARVEPLLRVGFVLLPRFTLTAFAGFVDVLRLAADEGDRSRPRHCTWEVLGEVGKLIESSCGVKVVATANFDDPRRYDYLVVVGGVMHGGQKIPYGLIPFLESASTVGVKLIGLCTGSFALARAGCLDGHIVCVSWFHREDFVLEFPRCAVVSNQIYVVDRDRLTCAGGTSVAHLAAYVIERAINRASAVKALRIMIERQPLSPRALQPESVLSKVGKDTLIKRAMLLLEDDLSAPLSVKQLAERLKISRRQLERRFRGDIGLSPRGYKQRLRVARATWLLEHTDLRVTDIAAQCGLRRGADLTRLIRRRLGCTPLQFRAARSDGA